MYKIKFMEPIYIYTVLSLFFLAYVIQKLSNYLDKRQIKKLQREKSNNEVITGFYESNLERETREEKERLEKINKERKDQGSSIKALLEFQAENSWRNIQKTNNYSYKYKSSKKSISNRKNEIKKKELDNNFKETGVFESDKARKYREELELKNANAKRKSRWIPGDQHRGDWNDK